MNTPDNIQKFNKLAGKTFSMLYESFPVRISLDYHEHYGLLKLAEAFDSYGDNIGDPEERGFVAATLEWLMESGYIRVAEFNDASAHGAVLTAKGLEVMNLVPETIGGKKNGSTVAVILRKGLEKASVDLLAEGMSWLLRKGLDFVPIIVHSMTPPVMV